MTESIEIVIDKEFAALLPPLTTEQRQGLRDKIIEEGMTEDLTIWKGHNILLDGHNRDEICEELGVEYTCREVELSDRTAARQWIIKHARSRRNMTEEQDDYLRGKQYDLEKRPRGGDRKSNPHSDGLIDDTAERLAKEHQVSKATIERDAEFSRAVDKIGQNVGKAAKQSILSGELGASKKDIVAIAGLPKAEQKKAIKGGKEAIKAAITAPKPTPIFPVSNQFKTWLNSIGGLLQTIRHDYGSLAKVLKHKGWDPDQAIQIAGLLKAATKDITAVNKEMQAYVNDH